MSMIDPSAQTETAIQPVATPALYPLDQTEFEIEIKARNHTLTHKLSKPTLAQLIERESQSHYETESVSDSEERVNADDEGANAHLWDAIAKQVIGYKLAKESGRPGWREVTDELKNLIPAAHKSAAVRGMYQFVCEVEADEDDGFTLAAENWTIKQIFGDVDDPDYVVRHVLRTPTERERRGFRRKSSEIRFGKGGRKLRTKVVTHLKAHVELYDTLIMGMDGTTFDNMEHTIQERAKLVDPIWKRQVIDTLMREFEAGLSD